MRGLRSDVKRKHLQGGVGWGRRGRGERGGSNGLQLGLRSDWFHKRAFVSLDSPATETAITPVCHFCQQRDHVKARRPSELPGSRSHRAFTQTVLSWFGSLCLLLTAQKGWGLLLKRTNTHAGNGFSSVSTTGSSIVHRLFIFIVIIIIFCCFIPALELVSRDQNKVA